jgi:hypothetical protein
VTGGETVTYTTGGSTYGNPGYTTGGAYGNSGSYTTGGYTTGTNYVSSGSGVIRWNIHWCLYIFYSANF